MNESLLSGFPDEEKTAFISAIASLATADHVATQEELDAISSLADAAELTDIDKAKILRSAIDNDESQLDLNLSKLKNSELRFSLVTELIAFAQIDGNYDESEKRNIEEISSRLGINNSQFSALNQFVKRSGENVPVENAPEKGGLMESLGLGDIFGKAGISSSGITKGLLAVAAPMLLSKIFGGRRGGRVGGGGIGSLLGGVGMGSLMSMLSGGRGFGNTGGLLSKILQRKR